MTRPQTRVAEHARTRDASGPESTTGPLATKPRRIITCRGCDRQRPHDCHELCAGCYHRWDAAGRPDQVPPPVGSGPIGARVRRGYRPWRLEDYAELTRERGLKPPEAAERLGISERTGWRYEASLREQEELFAGVGA